MKRKEFSKDDGLLCLFRSDNIQNYILDKIKDNENQKNIFIN